MKIVLAGLLCGAFFICGELKAKSIRTVNVDENDMAEIFVAPGYSTLLKFASRPEPGLAGDLDGFKVEYLKNIVSIKPLISTGTTNLFIFTSDGQFNFKLRASPTKHDDVVNVLKKGAVERTNETAVGKAVRSRGVLLKVSSFRTSRSQGAIAIKFDLKHSSHPHARVPVSVSERNFFIDVNGQSLPIENFYFQIDRLGDSELSGHGVVLARKDFKPGSQVSLGYLVFSRDQKLVDRLALKFKMIF